ncbi:MAG: type II secretion system F family protein, partial [Thermodesulfovibrionales bacterium]
IIVLFLLAVTIAMSVTYLVYSRVRSSGDAFMETLSGEATPETVRVVPGFFQEYKAYIITGFIVLVFLVLKLYPLAIASFLLTFFFKKYMEIQVMKDIIENFPNAVNIMKRSIRAGLPLLGAIKSTMEYSSSKHIREIFRRVYYMSHTMGRPVEACIVDEAKRLNIPDLMFLSSAIQVHVEAGGNLADTLDILEDRLRRSMMARKKVSSLMAEGRFSAMVLSVIPLIILVAVLRMSPQYLRFFITPEGRMGIIMVLAFYVFGVFITFRLVGGGNLKS